MGGKDEVKYFSPDSVGLIRSKLINACAGPRESNCLRFFVFCLVFFFLNED